VPRIDNDRYYDASISRYGFSAKGVQWRSQKSQFKRFEILLQKIPQPLETVNIVDAGCGTGALYGYMESTNQLPKHYLGLELKDAFVEAAKEYGGFEVRQCDVLYDPLPQADYYLCSGAMNILTRQD